MAYVPGDNNPNTLTGTVGDDVIEAFDGDDTLSALSGNDILYGGAGADIQYGGAGNDSFMLNTSTLMFDQISGGSGVDRLVITNDLSVVQSTFLFGNSFSLVGSRLSLWGLMNLTYDSAVEALT